MLTIPQSTAWNAPLQAYLSSDHVSAATGKTIAVTISKNGGAYGNPSGGATNATEIANGSYYVGLTTTDTNTLGPLFIRGAVATIDDVILILNVVKATNGGLTALPDTAVTTNASLLTSGTSTDQISVTSGRIDIGKALGTAVTLDSNNVLNVSAKYLAGTALTGRDIGASVLLSAGSGAGQLDFTSGVVKANATQWLGGTIPAVNVTGVPLVDVKYSLGTLSAGAAGYFGPDWGHVNAPTTTVGLTGTTISTSQVVASVSGAVGSVTGNVGGSVASVTAAVTVGTINSSASNIKKNVALSKFEFLMTDSTNHNPATGKTVTATRSIDGGAFAACANSVTELASGIYYIDLATTDLNGNVITLRFTATSCDDRLITVITQP